MIIIPARLQSTRLPNKLLLPIDGIPIVVRVANIAKKITQSIVACDDEKIMNVCKDYGIDCILTKKEHTSGTDRCAEAAQKLGLNDDEIILNLQGDEPFIEPLIIKNLYQTMKNKKNETFMASCYKIITYEESNDPNLVKVVIDKDSYAMYFSRSKIPHDRERKNDIDMFGHIGLYAFSVRSLREFCELSKSPLEEIEKLEQLRALWHNKKIFMLKVKTESLGIDTYEDYERAKMISKMIGNNK